MENLYIIQGDELYTIQKTKESLLKEFYTDDCNFEEFGDNLEIAEFTSALQQVPMLEDYYLVVATMTKKRFIRFKEYIKPSEFTILVLILEDFLISEDSMKDELPPFRLYDCRAIKGRDLSRWVTITAKKYGIKLDADDKQYLLSMYSSQSEIDNILLQMSYLNTYDRGVFLKQLFNVKDKFVWDLFVALVNSNKKQFFKVFAEQYLQNLELEKNQFGMKIVGGLIYCLNKWEDSPSWILEKISRVFEKEEILKPFLYCRLMEISLICKKEQELPLIMEAFSNLIEEIKKIIR